MTDMHSHSVKRESSQCVVSCSWRNKHPADQLNTFWTESNDLRSQPVSFFGAFGGKPGEYTVDLCL
jgi:hypothetical protein